MEKSMDILDFKSVHAFLFAVIKRLNVAKDVDRLNFNMLQNRTR